MTEIELRNITKLFGGGQSAVRAVDDVSLRIEPGELFFLLGPSGCGKTTLLRIIAGLTQPTSGAVLLGGRDVTRVPVEKRNTPMVFQSYALWPHMTVRQNVEFGPKMHGLRAAERRAAAVENLARVRMADLAARRPNQLSGGQQQRVALARALAAGPSCLLLDEPLSNLDAQLRLHMRGELRRLVKSTGTTAVYVTHDQKEALSMADRIAVMNEGQIAQVGRPEELYDRPGTRFVAEFMGEANFIEGELAAPGKPATVRTPAGVLAVQDPGALAQGARVTCCVRPEHIRISSPDTAPGEGESALEATIESDTFAGETRQFVCVLAEGIRWKVTVFAGRSDAWAAGRRVALLISPHDVAVLPA
ncbi:MAG TPA: ABC transporter ATP-binding protein [Phycisphaerae bacterium]|nr:ABC transporter ATP-binding protein [Phycisphaerae bacterium]